MFKFTFVVSQSTLVAAMFISSKKHYEEGDEIFIQVEGVELGAGQKFGHLYSDVGYMYQYQVVGNMPRLGNQNVRILRMPPLLDVRMPPLLDVGSPFVTFKKDVDEQIHSVEPVTFYGKIVEKGYFSNNFKGKVIFSYKVQNQDEFKKGGQVKFFGTGDSKLSVLKAVDVQHVKEKFVAATIAAEEIGGSKTSNRLSVHTPPSDSPRISDALEVQDTTDKNAMNPALKEYELKDASELYHARLQQFHQEKPGEWITDEKDGDDDDDSEDVESSHSKIGYKEVTRYGLSLAVLCMLWSTTEYCVV